MATEKKIMIHSTRNTNSIDGLSNVIVAVSWTRLLIKTLGEGEDAKTHTAGYPGVTELGAPDPNNFIDFENVTDDHLRTWITELVDLNPIDAQLEQHIQNVTSSAVVPRPSAE